MCSETKHTAFTFLKPLQNDVERLAQQHVTPKQETGIEMTNVADMTPKRSIIRTR
jgi:hypothetical protein